MAMAVINQLVRVDHPSRISKVPRREGLPRLDPGRIVGHRADAHWTHLHNDEINGHCSLWWRNTPAWDKHRVGMIGHFGVTDASAADVLLAHACRELAGHGCTLAVGPMDGSTWRPYRLITETTAEPRFLFEPEHPGDWPDHFTRNRFEPLAHYFSALNSHLAFRDPRLEAVARRMRLLGVRIRPLVVERFEDDLRSIHGVAGNAFRRNFLYREISEAEFIEQYQPLREVVPSDLVLIAERNQCAVGFVFAVPDLLQRERLHAMDTAVIKTLAVLPDRSLAGLGQLLLAEVQEKARRLGFTRTIHALVRDVVHLRRISQRYAHPIRRYTLFARVLS